jgi:hypothetical protein
MRPILGMDISYKPLCVRVFSHLGCHPWHICRQWDILLGPVCWTNCVKRIKPTAKEEGSLFWLKVYHVKTDSSSSFAESGNRRQNARLQMLILRQVALQLFPQLQGEIVVDIIIIPVILPLLDCFIAFFLFVPLCNSEDSSDWGTIIWNKCNQLCIICTCDLLAIYISLTIYLSATFS